jgi:hypothetical protein
VQLGLQQEREGKTPTNEEVIPGVITYEMYKKWMQLFDPIKKSIAIFGEFYEGAEILMFPPEWLDRAEKIAEELKGEFRRGLAIGIDPAEGGDKTVMAVVDDMGLIEIRSKQTPDTSVITGEAIAFMREYQVKPENVLFDRGGGGKQHADRLRAQGYNVRTVGFGDSLTPDPSLASQSTRSRLEQKEERYFYTNRRAQMYGELREVLDPARGFGYRPPILVDGEMVTMTEPGRGFGLPAEYSDLRFQLAPIPLLSDGEGRLRMLPKNKKDKDSKEKTLSELIGRSPDEADALVLALHGLLHKGQPKKELWIH